MNKTTLFLLLILFVNTHAVDFMVNAKILNFKKNYTKGIYRSGQIDGEPKSWWNSDSNIALPNTIADDEDPRNSYKKWTEDQDDEYQIIWDKPIKEIETFLIKTAKLSQKPTTSYDETSKETILNFPIDDNKYFSDFKKGVFENVTEQTLVDQAKIKAHKVLFGFRGRIEEDNVTLELIDGKVSKVTVIFRRIFRHGIVDHRVSYISMKMNAYQNVEEIKIKWPNFKKIDISRSNTIDFETAIKNAEEDCTDVELLHEGETATYNKVEMKGMACFWKLVNNDYGEILTPSYNFQIEYTLKDGKKSLQYVQVPRLIKYFK